MTAQHVLFLIFGAVTLAAAVGVVAARNIFHAALWLLLAFFGVGVLYVLLEAPFFAAAQLFIYMGAIGILIIFAVMLTRGMMRREAPQLNDQWGLVLVLAVVLLGVFVWLFWQQPWPTAVALRQDPLNLLGLALTEQHAFALPFEVISILLVMAFIGAVTIVRER